MKRSLALLGIFLAAILQSSFLPHFSARGFLPSIILVVVFCWCLLGDYREALFWAIGGGVLLDIFSAVRLSTFMLSLLGVVLVLYLVTNTVISFEKYYSRLWLAGLMSLLYYGMIYLLSWLFCFVNFSETGINFSVDVLLLIFLGTVANMLLILIAYPIISRYQKKVTEFTANLESRL